jgi:hypothetical protein
MRILKITQLGIQNFHATATKIITGGIIPETVLFLLLHKTLTALPVNGHNMVKTAAEINNVHSNEFVKTGVTPAVLAVTEMVWTLSYSHAVFHDQATGYVKLSFV